MNGTFHGGDELSFPVIVGGQNFVESLQFGVSTVVLLFKSRDIKNQILNEMRRCVKCGYKQDTVT